MKNQKVLKSLSLSIIIMTSLAQTSCSILPVGVDNSKTNTDNSKTNTVSAEKIETKFVLFKDADGASNPVTPDQIEYIQLNDKKVLAKDIQIIKGKDKLTGDIRFKGSGNYSFDQTTNNKDILRVKFVGSTEEQIIPLFKPGKEGFTIKATDNSSYQFRLIFNSDGSISGVIDTTVNGTTTSNNAFTVSKNSFTYYKNDGTAVSGSIADLMVNSSNINVSNANPGVVLQQVITQLQNKQNKTSVDGYIGIWSRTFFGNSVSIAFRKTGGSRKFKVSTVVAGKTYSSDGEYPEGETPASSLTIDLSVDGSPLKIKIENPSENTLKYTLLESDISSFKPFLNQSIELERVLIGL